MARRSGLGKGLSSLIPMDGVSADGAVAELKELPTSAVTPNPNQPRRHFDEEALVELSASIAEMGVLQPILVRPLDDERYELIAGERRWRAAQRAGLATVPAIVRTTSIRFHVERRSASSSNTSATVTGGASAACSRAAARTESTRSIAS